MRDYHIPTLHESPQEMLHVKLAGDSTYQCISDNRLNRLVQKLLFLHFRPGGISDNGQLLLK